MPPHGPRELACPRLVRMPCRWAARTLRSRSGPSHRCSKQAAHRARRHGSTPSGAGRRSPRREPPRGARLGTGPAGDGRISPCRSRPVPTWAALGARGCAPAPQRGKDHSDAVVSPSRTLVLGSRRAKACELVRPAAGSARSTAAPLPVDVRGGWRATSGVADSERPSSLDQLPRRGPGDKVRSQLGLNTRSNH